jgi:hypothetical protein
LSFTLKNLTELSEKIARPPTMKLLEIISDSRGAIAMISFSDNSVRFLRVKDKISEIEVIKVQQGEVYYEFNSRIYSLLLN